MMVVDDLTEYELNASSFSDVFEGEMMIVSVETVGGYTK